MSEAVDPDIRWRNVWASIRPYERTGFDYATNTRKEPMTVVTIEVRWEGERFTSRQMIWTEDLEEGLPFALTAAEMGIERMLIEHGYPPYEIRSEE